MDLKDQFKYLVGGYYGVTYMDDYPLKEFVLKDIENYIKDFIEINPIDNFNYKEEAIKYEEELSDTKSWVSCPWNGLNRNGRA